MATTQAQWNKAFEILSKFERRLLEPELFSWDFFLERLEPSKATLWRNKDFRSEFERVKKLVKDYKNKNIDYSLERSLESKKDSRIKELERQVQELTDQLDRERERLAYASMIARRKNIDPDTFMENSPLREAKELKKKTDNISDLVGLIKKNKK